jgi:hypothetical protein
MQASKVERTLSPVRRILNSAQAVRPAYCRRSLVQQTVESAFVESGFVEQKRFET